jgi:predicted nucleic acid-binding protein
MKRLVLDTNIFVAAAFKPGSTSGRIIAALRAGSLRMVWTDATRRETEQILRRIPPIDAEPFLTLFRPEDRYAGELDTMAFTRVPDVDDRKFAALACAAGATLITIDAHLLGAAAPDLDVQTPATFRSSLRATAPSRKEGDDPSRH